MILVSEKLKATQHTLVISTIGRNPNQLPPKTMKQYYFYIMSSLSGTLYVGMTNDLGRRVWQHKEKEIDGFTKRYNVDRLVYFEEFSNVRDAIAREKLVKKWRRSKKIELIESMNPKWQDLSEDWGWE